MIWQTKKLGEVCEIITGGTPKTSTKDFYGNEFLWAGPSDLDQGLFITNTKKKLSKKGFRESGIRLIPKDSVLLSCIGNIGKTGIAAEEMATNQQINTFVPDKKVLDSKYLYYALIIKTEEFKLVSSQTTLPIINKTKCSNIKILLPPLSEQKNIVKILDGKMGKIAEAKKLREEALRDTEKILSQTLREIFEEGKKKGWEEKTIDELAIQIKSGFACGKQNEVSDGIVHLRTHNISLDGQLNLDKIVRIPKSFVNTDVFTLKKDDIIFNNTNSIELVGKTILIQEDLPYAFSNHLTRIRFDKKIVIPSWVLYVFQKYWSDKVFERMCTRWVGQAGINQTSLSKLKILIPPLPEQQKIVKRLDAFSEKVRQAVELQKSQLEDLKKLEKAYLREAFNGELK